MRLSKRCRTINLPAKVILTGITGEPEEFLEILEANNIAVVGDDLAQEAARSAPIPPLSGGGGLKRLALQWKDPDLLQPDPRNRQSRAVLF